MAIVRPFKSIRPDIEYVDKVAALPYDVYNRKEAKEEVEKEPLSFLKIDRAETQFPDAVSTYDATVYEKAKELLNTMKEDGIFVKEEMASYYIYEMIMDGRSQTGIVACASIDDYENNVIKKHEKTRGDKEIDRITHVDVTNHHTGPIFLAYRSIDIINDIVEMKKKESPLYDFTATDGVVHKVWIINDDESVKAIYNGFNEINSIYIADGHHRTASAAKVGMKRREANPNHNGDEEYNFFLSVLFPHDQLMIMPYNRAVIDLNGLTKEEYLEKLSDKFTINFIGQESYMPNKKANFGMYFDNEWYELIAKPELTGTDDPVESLDVSILQDNVLAPILGIGDPRTDNRIDFIGGIRGLGELERRVSEDMVVAFSMYPTSIEELFLVSDADMLMPPKSTWFEPKLRSGIFIHEL